MTQSKHTRGPWKIHEHGVGFEVECANGNVVAQAQQVTTLRQDPMHSERKANARLIAESPTMRDLLLKLQTVRSPRELHNLRCEVAEALARIEGAK